MCVCVCVYATYTADSDDVPGAAERWNGKTLRLSISINVSNVRVMYVDVLLVLCVVERVF